MSEIQVIGPLRRVGVVKHGKHIGQKGTPEGGSQPGFTHAEGSVEGGGLSSNVVSYIESEYSPVAATNLRATIRAGSFWLLPDGRIAKVGQHLEFVSDLVTEFPEESLSPSDLKEQGFIRGNFVPKGIRDQPILMLELDKRVLNPDTKLAISDLYWAAYDFQGDKPTEMIVDYFDTYGNMQTINTAMTGTRGATVKDVSRELGFRIDRSIEESHLEGHVGQEGLPGGGSQPGFEHAGVATVEGDGEGHMVGEVYSVDANFFGTEEDILVELLKWDPELEAWTIEIISGSSRENIEESSVGSYDLNEPDEADLVTWTEPGGDALADRAVSILGLTDNYLEAGFILENGEMIDLSGKREGGSGGTRALDHCEVGRAMLDEDYERIERITGGGTDSLIYFMNETRAVRISYFGDSVAIDLATNPTRAQREVIEVLGFLGDGINALDISDEQGNLQWSGSIQDPEDISNEINRLAFEYLRNRAFITLVFRHLGGHIGQEGLPGGGSQPGFTHVEGEGAGEWNPEDDNSIEFGRKLSLDEEVDEARGVEFRNSSTEALKAFYEKVGIKPRGLTITNSYLDLADSLLEDYRVAGSGLNRFELAGYLMDRSRNRNVVGTYENDTLWLEDILPGDQAPGGERWNSTFYHELGHWVHNDVLDGFRQGDIVQEIKGSQRYIDEAKIHYGEDTGRLRREYVADLISAVVSAPSGQTPAFHRWDLGTFNETERGDLVTLRRIIDRAIEESPEIARTLDGLSEDKRFLVVLPKGAGEILVVTAEEAHRNNWPEGVEIIDLVSGLPLEISMAASSLMGALRALSTADLKGFLRQRWDDYVSHLRSL